MGWGRGSLTKLERDKVDHKQYVKNLSWTKTLVGKLTGYIRWLEIGERRAQQPALVLLPGESPRTEEPGRLHPMGSQRVGHDWVTKHRYRRRSVTGNNEKSEEIMLADYERFFTLCREVCIPVGKVSCLFSSRETHKSQIS